MILRGRACLLTLVAAAAVWPLAQSTASAAACTRGAVTPAAEASMLRQVNAYRATAGVAPLRVETRLRNAGRQSARSMARGGTFAHDGFWWAGGRVGAQNIAMAPGARGAVKAMMRSAPHRRNILNRQLHRAGVGAAKDCAGQVYFTLNLVG